MATNQIISSINVDSTTDDNKVPTYDAASDTFVMETPAGGSPGGSDTQVQFNDSSAFGGDSGLTYSKTNQGKLSVGKSVALSNGASNVNNLIVNGSYSLAYPEEVSSIDAVKVNFSVSGDGVIYNPTAFKISATNSNTDSSGTFRGMYNYIYSSSSTPPSSVYGSFFQVGSSHSSGTLGNLVGEYFQAGNDGAGDVTSVIPLSVIGSQNGAGTVSSMKGISSTVNNNSTGTVTNAYGLKVEGIGNSGGGTITNTYGIHVGDITNGTQTNTPYNIYLSDTNAKNYLGGNTEITGNLELGNASDTTLSRSSAGVLAVEGVAVPTISSTDTLSNKTLTAPKFADLGYIADANGNEMLIFDTVSSAVNEITEKNAATGSNPGFTATGGDTNVGIDLTAKGAQAVNIRGNSTQAGELRIYEDTDDGSNFSALRGSARSANITYTMPTADPTAGQVLSAGAPSGGVSALSWATASTGSMTLKTSSTGTTAQSITFSSLDLNTDEQYLFVIRYVNGAAQTSGVKSFQIKVNSDTGSNYSYAYQQYSNAGGGTENNVASNAQTIFNCCPDLNGDSDGYMTLYVTKNASNKAFFKWQSIDRDAGSTVVSTTEGGGYYNGSANVTSIQLGFMAASSCTKTWSIYVYKLGLT